MAEPAPVATETPAATPAAAVAVAAAPPSAPVASPAVAAPPPLAAAPPVSSPVVPQETKAPEPAVSAPVEPAPVTPSEAKPAEAAPAEPAKSLLGDQLAKPTDAKPEPAKPVEPPKVEPLKYETLKVPDGVQVNQEEVGKYTAILGEHQVPQEAAQQLMDLYVQEVQKRDQLQREAWTRTRETWVNEFKSDPEIGGNRQETTLQRCAQVFDQYAQAAGPERVAKLREVLGFTGAGDNPELVRFINWAAGFTVERGRPVAANVPKSPMPTSRAARRYANPAFSTGAT